MCRRAQAVCESGWTEHALRMCREGGTDEAMEAWDIVDIRVNKTLASYQLDPDDCEGAA